MISTAESELRVIELEDPETIAATLEELVHNCNPRKFFLDPIRDVQVLCPMNRGSLGVRELNQRLQRALNPARPGEPAAEKNGWRFQIRDKVFHTKNNSATSLFTANIRNIQTIHPPEPE